MAPKLYISDATLKRAAFSTEAKGYRVSDTKLGGFFVHVGLDTKSFRLQVDVPDPNSDKKRKRRTLGFTLGKWPATKADEAREQAQEILRRRDRGEPLTGPTDAITLLQAWESYKTLLVKKQRSPATIAGYHDIVERCLKTMHHQPLREITRQDAIDLHTEITTKGAPVSAKPRMRKDGTPVRRRVKPAKAFANGVMRVAHAIYNHAAKDLEKPLAALNPFRGRNLHNTVKRREIKLDETSLPAWFNQLIAIESPIWREWYMLCLLTGLRRRTVEPMRLKDLHFDKGYIEIPSPKGGTDRAFHVPISVAMRHSLERARRAGEALRSERRCSPWVFPSDRSKSGHVVEPKSQDIETTPHDLRRLFILFATGAGVIKTHRQVLANHRVARDVHEEYMSVPAMFEQLRDAQEKVSAYILRHIGKDVDAELERLLVRDLTPKQAAA